MIENRISGKRFETVVADITKKDVSRLDKKFWSFDWKKEHKQPDRVVYKLTTVENPDVIQGLVSLKDSGDHVFVYLVESASFNRGKSKLYIGVGGHLFAFACKQSFERGYDGYISFESKTQLVNHYQQELGAARIGSTISSSLFFRNNMKPDFKRLDDVDLEVVNAKLTEADIKEISAFIQEHKRKEKLKTQRKAAKKTQVANV